MRPNTVGGGRTDHRWSVSADRRQETIACPTSLFLLFALALAVAAAFQIRLRRSLILQRSHLVRIEPDHEVADVIVDARELVPHSGGNHHYVAGFQIVRRRAAD